VSKPKFDPIIMAELLKEPDVVKNIGPNWDADTLDWYKDLLVEQGIYAKYVKERKVKK
jgi:hypothetical protein